MAQLTALLVSLLTLVLSISGVISTTFTIINKCEYTVWPGILSIDGSPAMSTTGFALQKGESKTITAPTSWGGRFWGRTNCSPDSTGKFSCVTGDCGSGKIECSGHGSAMPATLAEFTLDRAGGFDFFDVSLVYGYNLPMKVVPRGGTGKKCFSASCVADLNDSCPSELKVTSADGDGNVACKSACMAFNQAEYCCTGAYSSSSTCKASTYSQIFKSACPQAYSYAYDDPTSTFTCASANYTISFCATLHNTSDTISPGQSLHTTETIVSANGIYGLGFFSPENSNKHYLVIYKYTYWSESYDDVVWVANREHPFPNSSAINLTFNSDGNLVISDGRLLHVLTHTSSGGKDTYARLLNTGNLVLTNTVSHILWQSFDYPTDTLLPGMKLKDAKTGWSLITSSTSIQDPAPGRFSLHYLASRKELIVTEESEPYWISSLTGVLADIFVIDGDYITWPSSNYTNEDIRSIRLDVSGNFILERVIEDLYWNSTTNGSYPVCGNFSICNEIADAVYKCDCLPGFKAYPDEGCMRKTILCSDGAQKDGFHRMSNVFLPTNYHLHGYDGRPSECESACLNNCSCRGYAYDQKNRCLVWYGPLLNMKQFLANNTYTKDFYLKLARADLVSKETINGIVTDPGFKNQLTKIVIPTASIAVVVTLCLLVYYVTRRKLGRKGEDLLLLDLDTTQKANNSEEGDSGKEEVQMPLFSFASVSAATDNFSTANKLGEGGFGPVYKGTLLRGNEVAVKRLSKRSGQGWKELKNEAMLIAKLQHKNLVRLLGCCIERDEKILIYEYMPNKSLDFFLFDREKRRILDWRTRVGVIEGIAQGLLYLHQYSRLRIIHRDLKPSNILLDIDMNPKISDFGMARIFGGNESQANTKTIVGTRGYMPPEYALEGIFSIKSDIFSFGVLLLEIVSGRKNTGFYQTDSFHLIGYAWELWTSDRGSDLVDPLLDDISSMQMVLRYVNIAFLCVQERANDRPTMSEVVAMLSNESVGLPYPKEPAFLNVTSMSKANPVNKRPQICSLNGATISDMEGR